MTTDQLALLFCFCTTALGLAILFVGMRMEMLHRHMLALFDEMQPPTPSRGWQPSGPLDFQIPAGLEERRYES